MRGLRRQGNLADGQLAFSKKRLRVVHPALDRVLMNRHSDGLAECRVAVGDADTSYSGDLLQREFAAEIVFDVGQHLSQAVSGHPLWMQARGPGYGAVPVGRQAAIAVPRLSGYSRPLR